MPGPLTADRIRRKLAGTTLPADPLDVDFSHIGNRMPQSMIDALAPGLRAAGVLIPLIEHTSELTVLLTERSPDLKHHAGQVSFPGGGMEAADADIAQTALRETHEEVGIHPSEVDVAGFLQPTPTITGYAVTPVIGFVPPTSTLTLDPTEVNKAFEVPIDFLMDERNEERTVREFEGASLPVVTFRYDGHRIWGATAGIIVTLRQLLIY